jgi:hypothetical protein
VRAGRSGDRGLADQPGRPRHTRQRGAAVDGLSDVSTTIKWPVIETVNPRRFDPCEDIPLDVIQRIGLAYTPPSHEDGLRCHYDAGNYQMAVEMPPTTSTACRPICSAAVSSARSTSTNA